MMRLAIPMLLCSLVIVGQERRLYKRGERNHVLKNFMTVDLEESDDAYRSILAQMRPHGMLLRGGIRHLINLRAPIVHSALYAECGLDDGNAREIRGWIISLKIKCRGKRRDVRLEAPDTLDSGLVDYMRTVFNQKKCEGGLLVRYQPQSDSLVQLSNDLSVSIAPATSKTKMPKISECDFSTHIIEFNDQFRAFDLTMQRAFMHFLICKIAAKDMLWSALIQKKTEQKRSVIGAKVIANSTATQAYRDHLTMAALGECIIDDPQLATPLEAIFAMYRTDYQRQQDDTEHHNFYAGYLKCHDWVKRLRRFTIVDKQNNPAS